MRVPSAIPIEFYNHWLHILFTGSNTHNNGNPAGDGQAGNDGQGQAGMFIQVYVIDYINGYLYLHKR